MAAAHVQKRDTGRYRARYRDPSGRERSRTSWRRNVAAREMERAGGSGWHALRHHCASVLIARGASVTAVAAMLGHSPAETLATYAAWFPSEDDVLRGLIGGAWGTAPGVHQSVQR